MRTTMDDTVHAILVHPSLDHAPEWMSFKTDCLPAMRRILGCQWIERVPTPIPGVSMWIDEEGALNPDATHNVHCSAILYPGRIMGPALLTGILPTGGMTSINAQQHAALGSRGITVQPRPSHHADLQWVTEQETAEMIARVRERIAKRGEGVTA